MAEPGRLIGQSASNADPDDIDADGEYELDDGESQEAGGDRNLAAERQSSDVEDSDVDAEGEEDEEAEPVGAVKIAVRRGRGPNNDEDVEEESFSDAKTGDSEDESSGAGSEDENQWQAESDNGDEFEAAIVNPNACIYCNDDEEHDPSDEYEEYLACAVCGDNAHQQCARKAGTLNPEDDVKRWRCCTCTQNEIDAEEDDEGEELKQPANRRRLSSLSKLTKELLPSHRSLDPGGHSIFSELILPGESTDGTRSLRKRKASNEEEVQIPLRQTRKKRRPSDASRSEAPGSIAASSSRPPSRSVRSAITDGRESEHEAGTAYANDDASRLRSARPRREAPKRTDKRPLVWIEDTGYLSLVISFHLNNEKVQKIVTAKPKQKPLTIEQERQERRRERDRERRERNRRAAQAVRETPEVFHYPTIHDQYPTHFPGFTDKETDESKSKPYGGVLSEADADTSKTYPLAVDRKRFDDARINAEKAWTEKQVALYAQLEPAKQTKYPTAASKIRCVNFGGWEIDTWHAAPYPEEYSKNRVLYICEFCLKYMNSDYVAWRHKLKCPAKHPPGDEIYRDGKHSFFEVDGRKNPVYCQNLCLLAKLFLGSKTLYYDVEPFLFYVMTENDNFGCHFVGYFSKEKRPSSLNNVSCILVLPIHMRKGYGQYLIEFSYLLTRVERKTGSPEKPLSDMGLVSYRKYWRLILCEELLEQKGPISISGISDRTGMTPDDIVSALEGLRALVRDPVTKKYALRLDLNYFKQYIEKCNAAGNPKINDECLVWTPYVMGRLGQYEDGPALQTVQQRDEVDGNEKPEEGVHMETASKANGSGNDTDPATSGIGLEDSVNGGSPVPGTPLANDSTVALAGSQTDEPSIPPTRYEIFPPIPGQPAQRRRPGRPFGARRRTTTPNRVRNASLAMPTAPVSRIQLSPNRRSQGSPSANGTLTPGTISLRRTRSRLGESVTNGDELEEGGAVKSVSTGDRRSTRSSASSLGSPHRGRDTKGKGRASEADEELENANADGDYEDDLNMDVDAEGEEDSDTIMVNS